MNSPIQPELGLTSAGMTIDPYRPVWPPHHSERTKRGRWRPNLFASLAKSPNRFETHCAASFFFHAPFCAQSSG
jgi:hypothetical protein